MSLILGMVAALAWGIHDLCVRHVSQTTGIFASIITVLFLGLVIVAPFSAWHWGGPMGRGALTLSLVSGGMFGLAAIALYKAFAIGPVRLVAPIIGAYPVLSVGWATAQGSPVTLQQWMAVGLVIAGVGYVAATSEEDTPGAGTTGPAITWSILAGTLFAITFALGQAAAAQGGEIALQAPTRLAALLTVLIIAVVARVPLLPPKAQVWILAIMGTLDAIALGCVISAGSMDNPEFAAVAASTFGVITIVLAAIFLRERISFAQGAAVAVVFAAIAYLGL